jgi:hypothetical protein
LEATVNTTTITDSTTTSAESGPGRRRSDADALDAICAVLNTTDSGADAYQEIALIILDTDRPFVDDLPVVEAHTEHTPQGLPRAWVQVDGETAVALSVDRHGEVHVRVTTEAARPIRVRVEGAAHLCDVTPPVAER